MTSFRRSKDCDHGKQSDTSRHLTSNGRPNQTSDNDDSTPYQNDGHRGSSHTLLSPSIRSEGLTSPSYSPAQVSYHNQMERPPQFQHELFRLNHISGSGCHPSVYTNTPKTDESRSGGTQSNEVDDEQYQNAYDESISDRADNRSTNLRNQGKHGFMSKSKESDDNDTPQYGSVPDPNVCTTSMWDKSRYMAGEWVESFEHNDPKRHCCTLKCDWPEVDED